MHFIFLNITLFLRIMSGWGPGFTEWTSVARAKPLFRGHKQPHIPADLGFYDLRVPETREAQAQLAKEAGVEGFCYWHYGLVTANVCSKGLLPKLFHQGNLISHSVLHG